MSTFYEKKKKKIQTKFILNSNNKFNETSKARIMKSYKYNDKKEDTFNNNIVENKIAINHKNILNSTNHNKNAIKSNELDKENSKREEGKSTYIPEDININMNINEEINQKDKIKLQNHKTEISCINNCITWTLKAKIKINKKSNIQKDFKSYYIFQGKNIFFQQLDFSILNAFNNSLCFDRCFLSNKIHFDNKKKFLEKLKQESFRQLKEIELKNDNNNNITCDNASLKNILDNDYPIDNNKNTFNVIDNNLCLKENLGNVFLLKFDLKNESNNNNDFRLINDNCVEREINFSLNGEIHGNKIFKNDLNFIVTYREFIKTIQFRLDNYKNKMLDYNYNKKHWEYSNKSYNNLIQEQNRKIFYGKMINNVNIGIEFLKPQPFEKLQTNFNSIVNSEIELTKIFIELTMPKILINNKKNSIIKINNQKEEFNKIEDKKDELCISIKKEEEKNKNLNIKDSKLDIPPPPLIPQYIPLPPLIPLYIPMPPPQPANWRNLNFFNMRLDNNGIPLPPPFSKDSTSKKLTYNNNYTNVTFDYLSINHNDHKFPNINVDPINIYNSPTSGTFSPMSASYLMMQPQLIPYYGGMKRHQSVSMNSPFNISNYSSPYISKNSNIPHLNINSRKYSNSFNSNELFDNLMDNNKIYDINLRTPTTPNKNGDENISLLNLQQNLTPEIQQYSLNETDISSNGNPHSQYIQLHPMTIKQRIIESYNKNNLDNKDKNKDIIDSKQNNKNLLRELRDSFILVNQEKTNFEIFLESASPLYKKNSDFSFLKIKIMDIFNNFKKISLLGLKNIYCFNGELIHLSYALTLSSLSIKIINKTLIDDIVQELKKKHPTLEKYNQLKDGEELVINISQYIIYFSQEYIQISFCEDKPYHFRKPFIKTISELAKNFPHFNDIMIEDINLIDSLFSILYSPLKCSKPYINYTSFVVYYQFTKENIQEDKINKDYLEYDKQTVTGVLPIKLNTSLYFQRIIIFNFVMNISPLFNYFSPYFNNDTIMIKNMAYAVINDVSKHIRGTSYDYECFMKLSKHNSINQWNIN